MNTTGKEKCENEILILLHLSRGAESRKKILKAILYGSKNCSQIARDVKLDWWTVQRHLRLLLKEHIVENSSFGNSKFYRLTKKGEDAIKNLSKDSRMETDEQCQIGISSVEGRS
jgi:predicted transcriptional regulator